MRSIPECHMGRFRILGQIECILTLNTLPKCSFRLLYFPSYWVKRFLSMSPMDGKSLHGCKVYKEKQKTLYQTTRSCKEDVPIQTISYSTRAGHHFQDACQEDLLPEMSALLGRSQSTEHVEKLHKTWMLPTLTLTAWPSVHMLGLDMHSQTKQTPGDSVRFSVNQEFQFSRCPTWLWLVEAKNEAV